MEIQIEPWAVNGPGLLVKKNDRLLLHYPDPIRATVTTKDYVVRLLARVNQDTLCPEVDELHVTRREEGSAISADTLRSLSLRKMMEEIVERTMSRWVLSDDGKSWHLDVYGETQRGEVALAFKPSRRKAIPIGEVEQAAAIYRQAVAEGRRDATEAVRSELKMSRTSAARRIAAARRKGLLGKAVGTRAGEA